MIIARKNDKESILKVLCNACFREKSSLVVLFGNNVNSLSSIRLCERCSFLLIDRVELAVGMFDGVEPEKALLDSHPTDNYFEYEDEDESEAEAEELVEVEEQKDSVTMIASPVKTIFKCN